MDSASTWRRSRKIWISLFLVANALDAITTFIELSSTGVIAFEINPIVRYFGWPVAIATKIGWIALIVFIWSRKWNQRPSIYKVSIALVTTIIMITSLFNVGQNWNPEISRQFTCTIINTKYGQGLMKNQLNINEIEYLVSQCL